MPPKHWSLRGTPVLPCPARLLLLLAPMKTPINAPTRAKTKTTTSRAKKTPATPRPRLAKATSKRAAGTAVLATPALAPTAEEIAMRAYEIYLQRQDAPGTPEDDWLRAEQELALAGSAG